MSSPREIAPVGWKPCCRVVTLKALSRKSCPRKSCCEKRNRALTRNTHPHGPRQKAALRHGWRRACTSSRRPSKAAGRKRGATRATKRRAVRDAQVVESALLLLRLSCSPSICRQSLSESVSTSLPLLIFPRSLTSSLANCGPRNSRARTRLLRTPLFRKFSSPASPQRPPCPTSKTTSLET